MLLFKCVFCSFFVCGYNVRINMNVTFTSKNKKAIQYIVNYFYTKNLTSDNLHAHIKYLQDKYTRGVTLVIHGPPTIPPANKKPISKKIKIRISEEKN